MIIRYQGEKTHNSVIENLVQNYTCLHSSKQYALTIVQVAVSIAYAGVVARCSLLDK